MVRSRNIVGLSRINMIAQVTGVLLLSQLLWAAKHTVSKDVEARIIYSGQFKGHVEPCG